jgi:DNA-binding Lrp family transcriptional regulator
MVKIDVERSKTAWMVFVEVLRGNNTMTAIKKSLKISHPSALDQLQKLEKAGYITGEKGGRTKVYTLNWEKLRKYIVNGLIIPKTGMDAQNEAQLLETDEVMLKMVRYFYEDVVISGILNPIVEISSTSGNQSLLDAAQSTDTYSDYRNILDESRRNMMEERFQLLYKQYPETQSTIHESLEHLSYFLMACSRQPEKYGKRLSVFFGKLKRIFEDMEGSGIYNKVFFEKMLERFKAEQF